jgi:ABC-2 type transport system permease protein
MSRAVTRRSLLANAWAQLFLVAVIVVLANTWSSSHFFRADLTQDGLHSLHLATRSLAHRLDKPMTAKVYFTEDLKAPAHNNRQVLIDMLEELKAYSGGKLEIQVADPTQSEALQSEARQYGIEPIEESYSSASLKQSREVYMGLALISGGRQQTLPAIRQTSTLEYDLARALKRIISSEDRKRVGFTQGHGEIDLLKGKGYQAAIRQGVADSTDLIPVALGGGKGVPEDIDALLVLGPTKQLDDRSLYHIDQFLMRGGALAFFVTNLRGDVTSGRARGVSHGLDDLLTHYGVTVNKDVVLDRKMNGVMHFPVRQGRYMLKMPLNYALMPRVTQLDHDSPIVGSIKGLIFPFASSLTVGEPLPEEVELTELAVVGETASRVNRLPTINPRGLTNPLPDEEAGIWPMMVSMRGSWSSFFAGREIPAPSRPTAQPVVDDPRSKVVQSEQTRMVVVGSLDFVGNNVASMLNLLDWMVQDVSLIGIRSKAVNAAPMTPPDEGDARWLRVLNLLGGALVLWLFGLIRRGVSGRKTKTRWRAPAKNQEIVLEAASEIEEPEYTGPTVEERARAALASDRAPRASAAPQESETRAPTIQAPPTRGTSARAAASRYGQQRTARAGQDVSGTAPTDPWAEEPAEEPSDPWAEEPSDPWAETTDSLPDPVDADLGDADPGDAQPGAQVKADRMSWSLADEVPQAGPEEPVDQVARERSRRRAVQARQAMEQLRELEQRHAKKQTDELVNAGVTLDDEPEATPAKPKSKPKPRAAAAPKPDKPSQMSVLQKLAAKKAESTDGGEG